MGRVGAVVVAAGAGVRFGGDKIFAMLAGRPVLAHSIAVFEQSKLVGAIAIVLAAENVEKGRTLAQEMDWRKVTAICAGGRRRQDSVHAGMSALAAYEWVIVHDGARPFVTEQMISSGLVEAGKTGAAVAAVASKDTVKVVGADGSIEKTLDRKLIWLAQTPQVFRRDLLEAAHAAAGGEATDDAVLLENMGIRVRVFEGTYANLKITTREDLAVAECIAARVTPI